VRQRKGEAGVRQLVAGLDGIDGAYLEDTNNWISLQALFTIFDNIHELFGDPSPQLFYELGKEVSATQGGALVTLAKWIGNTASIVRSSPGFNRRFNVDQEIEVVSVDGDQALVINYFLPEFYELERVDQCEWTKGILAGIPMLWGLPPAEVDELACSFRLVDVLSRDYAYLSLEDIRLEGGALQVGGIEYARRVALSETECGKRLFLDARETPPGIERETTKVLTGEYEQAETTGAHTGLLVTRPLIVGGKSILAQGEIYDAPYCLYRIKWKRLPWLRNLYNRTIGRLRLHARSRGELEHLLVLAEQRLFEVQRKSDELEDLNRTLEDQVSERTLQYREQYQRAEKALLDLQSTHARLVEEEKARRVYQVRAAQADAVARFLHQTSNLVLQPLASTMIVFEDLLDILQDCRAEWGTALSEEALFQELIDGLSSAHQVYPTANHVIEGYRELFHAFYEVYVSAGAERHINQDMRYIETLVRNKYILTETELILELDPGVPVMHLEGGVQSIFLELLHNAARHGARHTLVKTVYDRQERQMHVLFYNDGEPIPAEQREAVLSAEVSREGGGFGLADARYIVETLNGGRLRLTPVDREGYSVLFCIDVPVDGLA
jgi:hypothetical protein